MTEDLIQATEMHDILQQALEPGEHIRATVQGGIHESKKQCLLALTETRAIVILQQHNEIKKQSSPIVMIIPKETLSLAQREKFRRTHLWGSGGSEFGTYVDGFPHAITLSSDRSTKQAEDFEIFLQEWGGEMRFVSHSEAMERMHKRRLEPTLSNQFIGFVAFVLLLILMSLHRCHRWIQKQGR